MNYVTFDDYINLPGMNGSTLAHAFTSWKQLRYVEMHGYPIPADTTRVGTALHSMVEFLPRDRFDEYFVVQPDYHLSEDNVTDKGKPSASKNTSWCKDMVAVFADGETREVITQAEYTRITRMLQAISENNEAMDLIRQSEREITVTGDIGGVACKGRVDGFGDNIQWNLKTTNAIVKHRFNALASRLHYPFKDAFHRELLRQNNRAVDHLRYIVVLDARPNKDGRYREAPDCVVVPVPEIVIENQLPVITEKLRQYKDCLATGVWPGVAQYAYETPSWDMSDSQFEDTLI